MSLILRSSAVLICVMNACGSTAGTLDLSFHGTGYTMIPAESYRHTTGEALIANARGEILVAGWRDGSIRVWRYMEDGRLDPSFGDRGELATGLYGSPSVAMVLDREERIHLAVWTYRTVQVARFRRDGSPDPSFGTQGVSEFDPRLGNPPGKMVLRLDQEGRIRVAAVISIDRRIGIVLLRLQENATLDAASLQDPGFTVVADAAFCPGTVEIEEAAFDAQGRVLATGYVIGTSSPVTQSAGIWRFGTDGLLDRTFHGVGFRVISLANAFVRSYGVTVDPRGRLLITGVSVGFDDNKFFVIRFLEDGSLDPSFGSDGTVVYRQGWIDSVWSQMLPDRILVDGNGRVLVGGSRDTYDPQTHQSTHHLAIYRFDTFGYADASFAGRGFAELTAFSGETIRCRLGLDSHGRILALANLRIDGTRTDLYVCRYRS